MVVSAGASGGNIGQVAEDLLMRINADMDDRKSYTADKYVSLLAFLNSSPKYRKLTFDCS